MRQTATSETAAARTTQASAAEARTLLTASRTELAHVVAQLGMSESEAHGNAETARSETAAARAAQGLAAQAKTQLSDSRAELPGVSARLRKSESDCSAQAQRGTAAASATCRKLAEHDMLVKNMQEEHDFVIATTQSQCSEEVERLMTVTNEYQQQLLSEAAVAQEAHSDAEISRRTLEQLQDTLATGALMHR